MGKRSGPTMGGQELLRVSFDDVTTSNGGTVSFHGAEFTGSMVLFKNAGFEGGGVYFSMAKFIDGDISFAGAAFNGGAVTFEKVKFTGGEVPLARRSSPAAKSSSMTRNTPSIAVSNGIPSSPRRPGLRYKRGSDNRTNRPDVGRPRGKRVLVSRVAFRGAALAEANGEPTTCRPRKRTSRGPKRLRATRRGCGPW